MVDVFDSATRSRIMATVKGRDTTPEMRVRKSLHAAGFRFRLHRKDLPGKPDLVLPRYHMAVFVNGCFWHGHACRRGGRIPAQNRDYWVAKIARNVARDHASQQELQRRGWRCMVIWECELLQHIEQLVRALGGTEGSLGSAAPKGEWASSER
jgi:DNA mismatch endonuclease (patch repair protein)